PGLPGRAGGRYSMVGVGAGGPASGAAGAGVVGAGGGGVPSPQWPGPVWPSLKAARVAVRALVWAGDSEPLPTGGITSAPISASASARAVAMLEVVAPAAPLRRAAISWWARVTRPLPAG